MEAIDVEKKKLFNETWDLLDKTDRTDEDNITMLHKAHTSAYMWREANKPVNNARGEWQVSRVYSVLGFGQPALLHGLGSLGICEENGIGDFDLAFGYEAVARAYFTLGDVTRFEEYRAKGLAAAAEVREKDDREYVTGELNGIK
ncbi:MAG: hypothetical protein LBS90_03630 [Oscillospiraceae bacterium]|jgi:hypothetical protein|nr:hypothetical protein [Oscillospiraceae bacterium]